MQGEMVACSGCGRPLDARHATLSSETGRAICAACEGGQKLSEGQSRAATSLAYGALTTSVAAWTTLAFCGLLGLGLACGAIASGSTSLARLSSEDGRALRNRGTLRVVSIAGIVIGVLYLFGFAAFWMLSTARR